MWKTCLGSCITRSGTGSRTIIWPLPSCLPATIRGLGVRAVDARIDYFYALAGYDPTCREPSTNTPIIDNTTTGTQPLAGASCANSLLGTSLTSNIIN